MSPPNTGEPIQIISTKHLDKQEYQPYVRRSKPKKDDAKDSESFQKIVWRNVLIFVVLHSLALYGIWLSLSGQVTWKTLLFSLVYLSGASTGVTGGAHRLWSHKTYKAKLPFRIWLMLWQTAALQNDIHEWSRDHRAHHKFTDTDADPHNSNRGFFFCHIGWLMMRKHQDVIAKGKAIDMSDIEADPVVMWQRKYYVPLVVVLTFLLPTYIPVYFWNENLRTSFYVCIARYVLQLNGTWCVNSAAHLWGGRPYDGSINPRENVFVSTIGYGEGWHNYHHTFPWDYKAAELGNYRLNFTTALLNFMRYAGQVYDLKTASAEMIRKRVARTGDGSWSNGPKIEEAGDEAQAKVEGHHHKDMVWGWGDKDMAEEEMEDVRAFNNLMED
ncbi:unnamed protein product [Phyllotreta striolata]|uniref:Fatty acid desaturase domain-containing protein n=1 Tax=Phyllotreta striolata TaxID=444603 RepID=A0A9N9XTA0_PHYSR|nr:unnamed protein product [Phyllotreta striolata]